MQQGATVQQYVRKLSREITSWHMYAQIGINSKKYLRETQCGVNWIQLAHKVHEYVMILAVNFLIVPKTNSLKKCCS
jgi:hypothetical protein